MLTIKLQDQLDVSSDLYMLHGSCTAFACDT